MARSTLLQDMLMAVRLYFLRRENRGRRKRKVKERGRRKEERGVRAKTEKGEDEGRKEGSKRRRTGRKMQLLTCTLVHPCRP